MAKEIDKPVTFQGIRPPQCRCTVEQICEHCKTSRGRDTSWAEAVRKNNLEHEIAKGEGE